MGLFDLFGGGKKQEQVKEMLGNGALILDVRSPGEYSSGHVKGSQNVPLDSLQQKVDKIKKMKKPVVTCCASGMRSGAAASMLKQNGIEAVNGGSWTKVNGLV